MVLEGVARWRWLAAMTVAVVSVAIPATAAAPELAMLARLDKGAWDLRVRGEDGRIRVCVRNGGEFIQIRHKQPNCSRLIVEDTPVRVTVQYTCQGHGYGRTTIRRESGQLIQLQSQGIHDGAPFEFSAEGRRVGSC